MTSRWKLKFYLLFRHCNLGFDWWQTGNGHQHRLLSQVVSTKHGTDEVINEFNFVFLNRIFENMITSHHFYSSRLMARSRDSAENSIRFYLNEIGKQEVNSSSRPANKQRGLVVDGKTLTYILDLRWLIRLDLNRELSSIYLIHFISFFSNLKS